jgi:hypothetical protein
MRRLLMMSVGDDRMMRGLLVVAGFVMGCRLLVVLRGVFVVLGGVTMVFSGLL